MFIPYQPKRLKGLISLAHQTTNFPFSFVQEQNLVARVIGPGFFLDLKLKALVSNNVIYFHGIANLLMETKCLPLSNENMV